MVYFITFQPYLLPADDTHEKSLHEKRNYNMVIQLSFRICNSISLFVH